MRNHLNFKQKLSIDFFFFLIEEVLIYQLHLTKYTEIQFFYSTSQKKNGAKGQKYNPTSLSSLLELLKNYH